jgi:hypothetical protein
MHGIVTTGRAFFGEGEVVCARARELGLHDLVPGHVVDEYAFDPGGYSLNALREGPDDSYYTLHVTPEEVGSYVSFETNADLREPGAIPDLVQKVVGVFQPESFDVVSFVPGGLEPLELSCERYSLRKHASAMVGGFRVTFQHFFTPVEAPVEPYRIPLPPL